MGSTNNTDLQQMKQMMIIQRGNREPEQNKQVEEARGG